MKLAIITREFLCRRWAGNGISFIIVLSLWGGICPSACADVFLHDNLSFLRYTDALQPFWGAQQKFSHIFAQTGKEYSRHDLHLTTQSDRDLSNSLHKLTKKIRFRLSPKAVIKPFMIVQELQTLLQVYQSKQLRKKVQVDENFQAKSMLVPTQHTTQLLGTLKQSLSRTFSVFPYHHRIYGLHFQITW